MNRSSIACTTRYHSLLARKDVLPASLHVSAKTWEDEIMGIRHEHLPIYGVQYHPESILTVEGHKIINNFITIVERFYAADLSRERSSHEEPSRVAV